MKFQQKMSKNWYIFGNLQNNFFESEFSAWSVLSIVLKFFQYLRLGVLINLVLIKWNSRKSVRWSAVPVPCLSRLWLKLRGEQGSGPEGVNDLCFHPYGGFFPPPPPTSPLKSQSRGPNSSLEAQIPVLRPKSQPQGLNLNRLKETWKIPLFGYLN